MLAIFGQLVIPNSVRFACNPEFHLQGRLQATL
jgi:hypothetical protein